MVGEPLTVVARKLNRTTYSITKQRHKILKKGMIKR